MTGPEEIRAEVESAATALRARIEARLGGETPGVAITMGSGLGGLGAEIEDPVRVPYEELPGWPRPTVIGHAGHALIGTLGGRPVLGLSGRVHLYEGGPPARVAFYVRVAAALGIPALFLSNAAGAIRAGWHPGELMLISDHLNLTGTSPLIGPVVGAENRFPDLTFAYDRELRARSSAGPRTNSARRFTRASTRRCTVPPSRPPPRSACCGRWARTPWACRRSRR